MNELSDLPGAIRGVHPAKSVLRSVDSGELPAGRSRRRRAGWAGLRMLEPRILLSTTWFVAGTTDPLEDGSPAHPFDSIQEAIDAAAQDDSVEVGPGLYVEDLVINVERLRLCSSEGRAATTIQLIDGVGIEVNAHGLTMGGAASLGSFEILSGPATTEMIHLADGLWQVTIEGGLIDSTGAASTGIDAGQGASLARIVDNLFRADDGDVSVTAADPVNMCIEINTFVGAGGAAPAGKAIELVGASGGATVARNRIRQYELGVAVHNGGGASLTAERNDLVGCGTGLLFADSPGPGQLHFANVRGGNLFYANEIGILVEAGSQVRADAIYICDANYFVDNVVAVENRDSLPLAAGLSWRSQTYAGPANWWGHRTGPSHPGNPGGQGDVVIGPVDFAGWLQSPDNLFRPCLDAQFGELAIPQTIVPGDSLTVPVQVGNVGIGARLPAAGVSIYLSADGVYDPADTVVATGAVRNLASRRTKTWTPQITVGADWGLGPCYLIAVADAAGAVDEFWSDVFGGNNVAVTGQAREVAWMFGNVPGRDGNVVLLLDNRYELAGPGCGQVTPGSGPRDVALQQTDATTTVRIEDADRPGKGRGAIRNLTAADEVGAVLAGGVNVWGEMSFASGVSRLRFANIWGGAIDVDAGAVHDDVAVVLKSAMGGAVLDSELPIRRLSAGRWEGGGIVAPSIGLLRSAGEFQADLGTFEKPVELGRAVVGNGVSTGGLRDAVWYLTGTTGELWIGNMTSSRILVDVDAAAVTGLPTAGGFVQPGRIGKLRIAVMQDSVVAAGVLGQVSLGRVATDNQSKPFGFAAEQIRRLLWQQGGRRYRWAANWPADTEDFIVRLV